MPSARTCPREAASCRAPLLHDRRRAPGQVLGQEQARLSAADEVHVAVAVDVTHRHLKPAAGLAAIVDRVACPGHGVLRALLELVPINSQRIVVPGRGARARRESLALYQV